MSVLLPKILVIFSSLFFVIDPVGLVPIFLALTISAPETRKKVALRATIAAALILLFFTVFGTFIFRMFGITIDAFRIAGGLLFMGTAIDMLRGKASSTRSSRDETEEDNSGHDIALIPIAIPLLAGPGAIAAATVSTAQIPGALGTIVVLVSILVTLVACYLILLVADRFSRFLGKTGIAMLERLMGLLIAAIGVQYVVDGIVGIARS